MPVPRLTTPFQDMLLSAACMHSADPRVHGVVRGTLSLLVLSREYVNLIPIQSLNPKSLNPKLYNEFPDSILGTGNLGYLPLGLDRC